MLTVSVVDANERAASAYRDTPMSVVSQWLRGEMKRAGVENADPRTADLVLLTHAGALDWLPKCRAELKRRKIEPDPDRRAGSPYILAGGAVCTTPLTAMRVADAVAIGEAYRLVRDVLGIVTGGGAVEDVRRYLVESPHALESSQLRGIGRDAERPWLMDCEPGPLATPDDWIDWMVPPVKSDDHVVRVIGAKGCARKCVFCATSWSQKFQVNPHGDHVVKLLHRMSAAGERVQLLSNDPSQIPYYRLVKVKLDSESYTVKEGLDPSTRRAIIEHRPRMARFGVEGISERIRLAFGKPVPTDGLVEMLTELHANRINTHLFLIAGAPFEQDSDMTEFVRTWEKLAKAIQWGICRIKMTTFNNIPPAPLARFLPGNAYEERYTYFLKDWRPKNAAAHHIIVIPFRKNKSRIEDVSQMLAVPKEVAMQLCANPETFDLAPTLRDFRRMQGELVRWPQSAEGRYRAADVYRSRMGG